MKIHSHSSTFLCVFCGVILLSGSVYIGNSAEAQAVATPAPAVQLTPAIRPPMPPVDREVYMAKILEREANAKVVLRAVGTVGGAPVAMFDVNDEPKLVTLYSGLVGQVAEIDVAKAQVTVRARDGSLRVFTLTEPRPVKFPSVTDQPELQERMMRMPEEKMRRMSAYARLRTQGVPDELVFTWAKLNREAKEAILLFYLQAGLVVSISSDPVGETSVGSLFERQMAQRSRERMKAFMASLTPEQRELFKGSAQGLVRIGTPPAELESLADKNRRAGSNLEQLLASLTPEQRKLYDAIHPGP